MNYEIHEDSEGNVFVKNLSMVSLVSHSQSVTLSVSQSVSHIIGECQFYLKANLSTT